MKKESASSTAYTVLHGILHTSRRPELAFLVSDDVAASCEKILSALPEGRKRLAQLNSPLKSKILPFLEWLLIPGITLNYVLRKRFIEEQVCSAIDDGITQIVNIGAGFDTLAWRLSRRFSPVNFIEIDHPATSAEKRSAVAAVSESMPNLHFVAADLSHETIESALNSCAGFDSGRKTLYICEGVLMYLEEPRVIALFDAFRSLTGSGTLFIFSCMEPRRSVKHRPRPLLQLYLALKSERYRWYLGDTDLTAFLRVRNYTLKAVADSDYYRRTYLGTDYRGTLHRGEYVVTAEVD